MNSAGLKIRFFSGAMLVVLFAVDCSTAEAFIFRRLFSNRRQPQQQFVFRQPQPQFVQRFSQPINQPVVRSCNGFSCTIQRQPIVYNNGGNQYNYNNNGRQFVNNRFDPNDFDQVAGFNRLKQQKGVLFEANSDSDVVSQLFIDPNNGQLLSVGIDRFGNVKGFARPVNTDNPVFTHLSKFYFENLDKFKTAVRDAQIEGNKGKVDKALRDLQLVNSFLGFSRQKLGLTRNGQVNFDISGLTVPSKYLKDGKPDATYSPQNVGVAGLNYVLNMLTNSCNNLCVGPTVPGSTGTGCTNVGNLGAGGIIPTNLSGFFNNNTIDFMTNAVDNPYACGDRTRVRADHFIAAVLGDPKMYYAIKQIPGNYEEYAAKKGTDFQALKKAVGRQAKMVVGPGESVVAHRDSASRITGVERQDRVQGKFGGRANGWMSFDYNNFNDGGLSLVKGAGADLSRDPVGAIGNQAGGESIFEQCNGMHEFMVIDGNGNRVDEVPGSIAAHSNAISGPAVANPLSCIQCHQFGFRSGSQHESAFKNGKVAHNTNVLQDLGAREAIQARARGFRDVAEMRAVAAQDNVEFANTLAGNNSLLPDPKFNDIPAALPYDIVQEYYKPMDNEKLSRELGTQVTAQQLAGLRGADGSVLVHLDKDGKIDRTSFALAFCELRSLVTGGAVDSGNGVQRFRGNGNAGRGRINHQTGRPF